METRIECYSIGPLLYCPANSKSIAKSVTEERFGKQYSLALCLEDTIAENGLKEAEEQMLSSLKIIKECESTISIPRIFIRVRNPEHLRKIHSFTKDVHSIIYGYIFPKYSLDNADEFNAIMREINADSDQTFYMMPILESRDIIELTTRTKVLNSIKEKIDGIKEYTLNIRVGGNDFSNYFSVRRHYDETIYDILPLNSLLSDILTVFSGDYVISGAVWEYYSSDNNEWRDGLRNEINKDVLNGFVGKTVIHPNQIDVVNEYLKVSRKDYLDAGNILNWNEEESLLVSSSENGERMNEKNTHENWAKKILLMAKVYGVK